MNVNQCVVLLDREQGGRNRLEEEGVRVTSILTVSQVLKVLRESEKITEEMEASVSEFIVNNHTSNSFKPVKIPVSLGERIRMSPNKVTQKLFQIVLEKKTNVCVAVDCVSSQEMLKIVEKVGPYVAVIKIHQDIIRDWTDETSSKLRSLADACSFLIFEDRKYADIGNTVELQAFNVVTWADIVTVHGVSGPGVLEAIDREAQKAKRDVGALMVAEMSCADNLGEYFLRSVTQASLVWCLILRLIIGI